MVPSTPYCSWLSAVVFLKGHGVLYGRIQRENPTDKASTLEP